MKDEGRGNPHPSPAATASPRGSHRTKRRICAWIGLLCLAAVIFLVEGYWVEKEQMLPRPRLRGLEEGLRTAYHLEICGAQNYERAAEGTTDACLSRILRQFAQEKYTRADRILKLLSQHCR